MGIIWAETGSARPDRFPARSRQRAPSPPGIASRCKMNSTINHMGGRAPPRKADPNRPAQFPMLRSRPPHFPQISIVYSLAPGRRLRRCLAHPAMHRFWRRPDPQDWRPPTTCPRRDVRLRPPRRAATIHQSFGELPGVLEMTPSSARARVTSQGPSQPGRHTGRRRGHPDRGDRARTCSGVERHVKRCRMLLRINRSRVVIADDGSEGDPPIAGTPGRGPGARRVFPGSGAVEKDPAMIILGVILLILGFVFGIPICGPFGIILIVVGAGALHPRRHRPRHRGPQNLVRHAC